MHGYSREFLPIGPLQLRVQPPEGRKAKLVSFLVGSASPRVEEDRGDLMLIVPSVLQHEVVAVDFWLSLTRVETATGSCATYPGRPSWRCWWRNDKTLLAFRFACSAQVSLRVKKWPIPLSDIPGPLCRGWVVPRDAQIGTRSLYCGYFTERLSAQSSPEVGQGGRTIRPCASDVSVPLPALVHSPVLGSNH